LHAAGYCIKKPDLRAYAVSSVLQHLRGTDTIYLLTLEDNRGSQNHAVAVYDGMIFDANESSALKLCTRNLHRCLGEGYRCKGVSSCYVFEKAHGKRKRKRGAH
jgi:hypothetical protein